MKPVSVLRCLIGPKSDLGFGTIAHLRTVSSSHIPRSLGLCRAIKSYSVPWRNLAVVWTVRPVIDATLAVADDRIWRSGNRGVLFNSSQEW